MRTKEQNSRHLANLNAALAAGMAGCKVHPCDPKTKKPFTKWKTEATSDIGKIKLFWEKFPNAMPAIVTGKASGFTVVDLDIKNGKDGVAAYKDLGLDPDDAGTVVKTASGGLHLYFDCFDGVGNSVDKLAPGIDIRGDDGYVIAPGAVGEIGRYDFLEGDLEIARLMSPELPEQFRPNAKSHTDFSQLLGTADPEAVRSALFYIPNDVNYEDWVRMLMALHHGFEGSDEGLQLAQEWCSGYAGYDPQEVKNKWTSFELGRNKAVTVGSLYLEARAHGWDGQYVAGDTRFEGWIHPAIQELNERFAFVRMGSKVAIAEFKSNGDIELMTTAAFRELFLNRRYGKKTLGNAWLMHSKRRTYQGGLAFRPDGKVPPDTLNLWTGFALTPNTDLFCSNIIQHIWEVLADCDDDHADYIMSWLAHIVQNPAEKPDVALVLKGEKGAGKDTLAEIMKAILGRRHYAHVPASERLTGRFNSAFATALMIHVEEASWGGNKDSKGVVQSLITCPEMPLERKNIDTEQVDSFCRLLFTTNESWAVPATADERRYAVFEVSSSRIGDRDYFKDLWREIHNGGCEAFLAFLLAYQQPDTVELRSPPRTRGLMQQKISGLRGFARWWYEVLCEGALPGGDFDDTADVWEDSGVAVSRESFRQSHEYWIEKRRYQGEIIGPEELGALLREMCPSMKSSRPTENGVRVRKYVFPPLNNCRHEFSTYMGGVDETDWSD